MNMIVKIAPLGEVVVEVNVASGTTVAECLRVADVDLNGRTITVNDSDATESTPIQQDGSIVALISKMKGGR
jgi:phage terminase large subunit-like protein